MKILTAFIVCMNKHLTYILAKISKCNIIAVETLSNTS